MKPVYFKGLLYFLIALLPALVVALQPFAAADTAQPTAIGWLVILIGPLLSGLIAIKAFISRDYADHQDAQAAEKEDDDNQPFVPSRPAAESIILAGKPLYSATGIPVTTQPPLGGPAATELPNK